ncbi:MAG: hypothetical protein ACJAW0_000530 [Zhongshania sp.]|jgi:hypothetical protein
MHYVDTKRHARNMGQVRGYKKSRQFKHDTLSKLRRLPEETRA